MNKVSYRFNNLSVGYCSHGALRRLAQGLTAELRSGELTCLIGTNGSGKSTLLRTMAGFQPPLEGRLVLHGRELQDYSPRELAREVGVVLTDGISCGAMTAEEVVSLGRMPYTGMMGSLGAADVREVADAMQMMGIGEYSGRRLLEMSDGERQKVVLAKVLAQHTPVILLDEPTSFLDYPSKVMIMQLLADLAHQQQLSVLYSTHDLELAFQMSDCFWVLGEEGRWMTGTLHEIETSGILAPFHYKQLSDKK